MSNDGLRYIGQLQYLRTLNLTKTHVTDSGMRHLERLRRLTLLSLSHTRVTGNGLSHISCSNPLRYLYLNHCDLSGSGLTAVARFRTLRTLSIHHTGITTASLHHLRTLNGLKHISIGGLSASAGDMSVLGELPHLISLSFSQSQITDAHIQQLSRSRSLEMLSLVHTNITGDISNRVDGFCTLRVIGLLGSTINGSPICDRSVAFVSGLHQLQSLTLTGEAITAEFLNIVQNHENLREIRILRCQISDEAIKQFTSHHPVSITTDTAIYFEGQSLPRSTDIDFP